MGFFMTGSYMYTVHFDQVNPPLPFLALFPTAFDPVPLPNSSLSYCHILLSILMTQRVSLEIVCRGVLQEHGHLTTKEGVLVSPETLNCL